MNILTVFFASLPLKAYRDFKFSLPKYSANFFFSF